LRETLAGKKRVSSHSVPYVRGTFKRVGKKVFSGKRKLQTLTKRKGKKKKRTLNWKRGKNPG